MSPGNSDTELNPIEEVNKYLESTMSSSSRFVLASKDDVAASNKGELYKLTGQDNYSTWASAMKWVLKAQNCFDIVTTDIKPEEDASKAPKDWEACEKFCQYGANAIIARVSVEIMEKILEFDHPREMWTYLRAVTNRSRRTEGSTEGRTLAERETED